MDSIIKKMIKELTLEEADALGWELNNRKIGTLSEFEEKLMAEARQAVAYSCQVVLLLGHCGASPTRYLVFNGSKDECEAWIDDLPETPADKICSQCGGYTGTNPVKEECFIEEAEALTE